MKKYITPIIFLYTLLFIITLFLAYYMDNKVSDVEDEMCYLKECYTILHQENEALKYENDSLKEQIDIYSKRVDNIIYNVIGGKW